MNKIQQYKEILEQAPEGTTDISFPKHQRSDDVTFFRLNMTSVHYFNTLNGWLKTDCFEGVCRSSDVVGVNFLQTIVEQAETIERLKHYISAIKHKSKFQIGNHEGLQDVLRRIEWLTEEALNND